jgi:hypothetical protein
MQDGGAELIYHGDTEDTEKTSNTKKTLVYRVTAYIEILILAD